MKPDDYQAGVARRIGDALTTPPPKAPALALVVGAGTQRLWGMTAAERLRRAFVRAGLRPIADAREASATDSVVIARGDWVMDEALTKALAREGGVGLVSEDGVLVAAHVAGADAPAVAEALAAGDAAPFEPLGPKPAVSVLAALRPLDLEALSYNSALRKREPVVLTPLTAETVRAVEARLFKGSYKGVTDIVTKYVWPTPARIVTRWCAQAGLKPNHVTYASLLLVFVALYLFWIGQFGWGLLAAWVMTFLDTVDGKLARVSLTSSSFGNILDHGIDLVHPPFWWWAWLVGVQAVGIGMPQANLILAVIFGGYVLQRLEEGVFMRRFGMHIHSWRRFDSRFRLITARRNPNLILLTLAWLLGRPDLGIMAVALWTAICLIVHLIRLIQALMTPRPLVSWMSEA